MVSPSAAVTVTRRVFSPVTRPTSPETTTVASASVVSTFTSTSVVPLSSSSTSPSSTSLSLIVKVERDVSSEAGTTRTTRWSWLVTPSAAVTLTTRSFSPATSSESPTIAKVASGSVVSTVTSTDELPGERSTESPSVTSAPSTWNVANDVSLLSSTTIVTV